MSSPISIETERLRLGLSPPREDQLLGVPAIVHST